MKKTVIHVLKVKDIDFDPEYNLRHASHLTAESSSVDSEEEGQMQSIEQLSHSIELEGQDTPITVRPHPDKFRAKKTPWVPVTGTRRGQAMLRIAKRALERGEKHPIALWPEWSADDPTIEGFIEELSESEAILLNIRENTARNSISGADLAFAIHKYWKSIKREPFQSEREIILTIARSINRDPFYVQRCLAIVQRVLPEITAHWRVSPRPVRMVDMMQLTDPVACPPENQKKRYAELCGLRSGRIIPPTKERDEGDPDSMEKVLTKLRQSGEMLGRLTQLGYITMAADLEWTDAELLRELGPRKKRELDVVACKAMGFALKRGFEEGTKSVETARNVELVELKGSDVVELDALKNGELVALRNDDEETPQNVQKLRSSRVPRG